MFGQRELAQWLALPFHTHKAKSLIPGYKRIVNLLIWYTMTDSSVKGSAINKIAKQTVKLHYSWSDRSGLVIGVTREVSEWQSLFIVQPQGKNCICSWYYVTFLIMTYVVMLFLSLGRPRFTRRARCSRRERHWWAWSKGKPTHALSQIRQFSCDL